MLINVTGRSLRDLDTLSSSNTNGIFKNIIEDYGFCDVLPCSYVFTTVSDKPSSPISVQEIDKYIAREIYLSTRLQGVIS
jgi:hypothetical protein